VQGGWAPDKLRHYPEVLEFIKVMDKAKKPIGQICHAGWVLISADILQGKEVTSTPGIKDDTTNAGATWSDEAVVVDGHLISRRRPLDLPPYVKAFAHNLAESLVLEFILNQDGLFFSILGPQLLFPPKELLFMTQNP